jgi:GWxTD domain-containing protein
MYPGEFMCDNITNFPFVSKKSYVIMEAAIVLLFPAGSEGSEGCSRGMISRIRSMRPVWTIVLACAALGCGGLGSIDSSDYGKTSAYTPGTPDFDLEAVESVRGRASGVDLYFRIPWSSLIFVRDTAAFTARFELRARLIPERTNNPTIDRSWIDTLRSTTPVPRDILRDCILTRRIDLPPGAYIVEGILEDANSATKSLRRQQVHVFGVHDSCPLLLRPRLEHFVGSGYAPFLPLHVSRSADSLRAVFTVWHPEKVVGRSIEILLLHNVTDTLPGNPPYYLSPPTGSLRYMGVDLRSADTIWRSEVNLEGEPLDSILISLAAMRPGFNELAFRAVGERCGEGDEPEEMVRRRFFVVLDREYPRVTRLRQMTEALVYLASEKEFNAIRAVATEDERRRKFDQFWLQLGETPQAAANLIKQYYTRMEEANRLFSSFKEGWKTDRGMVYMIFGPPSLIETRYRTEQWSYSTGVTFLFQRETTQRGDLPFLNWTLQRDAFYEWFWQKEIGRWRGGHAF